MLRDLDPEVEFGTGYNYAENGNFRVFLDSSPDRWGCTLMDRRENILARNSEPPRRARKLLSSDYLLGVHDALRLGGLRFKTNPHGEFLDNDESLSAPPTTSLPELAEVARKIQNNDCEDEMVLRWLSMLIAPGASLGGARPKACIRDGRALFIAKFPARSDNYDVGAWEYVVYQLALKCGLNMTESRIEKFNNDYHTFITKRFDRTDDGERIHFASAMTRLKKDDGDRNSSYLELAEIIQKSGADNTKEQLGQLWRRIVFSVAISNTDDHLRNHGFIYGLNGWELSPAYDINPTLHGEHLELAINDDDGTLSFQLALEVVDWFQLSRDAGVKIIEHVIKEVSQWEGVAKRIGIGNLERKLMSPAFNLDINY